jgi:hypothetical protein
MSRRWVLAAVGVLFAAAWAHGQDIFVTPIPNAPFSGVIEVQRTVIGPNGLMALRTTRLIARDSRGRVHNERRTLVPPMSGGIPQLLTVHLYDPETRLSTVVDEQRRTYWTMVVTHPPATQPPRLLSATPAGSSLPPNDFTKEEDLGTREMSGVQVHGVRDTQTIPASRGSKTMTVTDEYWYSDDLRINLKIKHDDPRTGSVTMTVSAVQLNEPDATLFQIPKGYKRLGN